MRIKHMFYDLNSICKKKKYYFKNGEEELYFSNERIEVEIYHFNESIDLIISKDGNRANYQNSSLLSTSQKDHIYSVINSFAPIKVKCSTISNVLLGLFKDYE